jgi:hypothetical protein
MDLILIGSSARSAAVHGLNWTRHCTIDASSNDAVDDESNAIVGLAWHPSGRRCMAARRNGIIDVGYVDHNKDTYSTHVLNGAPADERIVGLSMVHQVNCEPACIYVDRAGQHFPNMRRLRKTIDHLVDAAFAAPVPHVSNHRLFRVFEGAPIVAPRVMFQCVLTSAHRVILLASKSMLRVATTDVVGELRDGDDALVVRQCSIAPDMSAIVSLVQRGDVVHFSCRHGSRLWEHRGEVAMLGWHRTGLFLELQEIFKQVDTMRTQWKSARQPFQQKLDALSGMLRDAGSTTTLVLEFEGLVTTGRPSPTLQQFMAQQIGEQTVRRLHAALKQSLVGLQHRISSFVSLLLDEFVFRVDEMRSCAHWTERFAPLGVNPESSFTALSIAAEQLALALSNVSTGIALIAQRYESFWTFFTERVAAVRAVDEEEPSTGLVGDEQVLAFIKFDILYDNVLALLEGSDMATTALRADSPQPTADTSTAAAIRSWQEFVARMPPPAAPPLSLTGALEALRRAYDEFLVAELPQSAATRFDEWCAVPLCSARAAKQPYSLSFAVPDGYSFAYDYAAHRRLADEAVASAAPALLADIEHASEVSCTMAVACVAEAPSGDGGANRTIVLMHLPSPLDALGSDGEVCAFQLQARRITSLSYSRASKSVVVLHEGGAEGGAQGQLSMFDVSGLEFQPFEVEMGGDEPLADRVLTSGVLDADAVPLLAPSEARGLQRGKAKFSALHVNHDRSLAAVQIGKRRLMLMILEGGAGDEVDDDEQAAAGEADDEEVDD